MIGGLIALASFGIAGGGNIGNFLYQLENAGVFSYVLPFLMIFAVVYAILSHSNFLGNNNTVVNLIVSIAVALMALQFQFVSYFFSEIFPRLGVALSIILTFMILLGLFVPWGNGQGSNWTRWFFGILAGIAGVIILVQSFSDAFGWNGDIFGGGSWYWVSQYSTTIIICVLVLGVIIGVPLASARRNRRNQQNNQGGQHH